MTPASYPIIFLDGQESPNTHNHQMLVCPICGIDCVHLEPRTVITDGGDNYKARADKCRGGVISLYGWCENGCRFAIHFGFHKGSTIAWSEGGENILKDGETPPDMR